jgi:hypothetical protein
MRNSLIYRSSKRLSHLSPDGRRDAKESLKNDWNAFSLAFHHPETKAGALYLHRDSACSSIIAE